MYDITFLACPIECTLCTSPTSCSACVGSTSLSSSRLLNDCRCPDGYYSDMGVSDEC